MDSKRGTKKRLNPLRASALTLGLGFALFLSVFALDVFETGEPVPRAALAFAIHLAPSALVALAAFAGWKNCRLGAVLFIALAIVYAAMTRLSGHWLSYLLICGPLVATAVLFLLAERGGNNQ